MSHQPFERGDVTLGNWRQAPYSRWSFRNVREIVPTAAILDSSGLTPARPGPDAFSSLHLEDPDGAPGALSEHLVRSRTDSFVAMRDGDVIGEWHADPSSAAAPHIVFSVSKSITGMLAGIAIGDGALDPDAPVTDYVAMPAGAAYASARVRDLLDMTVSLDFDEAYLDAGGAFDRYRRAMLWNPEPAGEGPPETMQAFLETIGRASRKHGERFFYASPNTDLLGLVLERAVGMRFHDFMRERLWAPMGASGPACVTIDRAGTARAAGGICVTTHDLARFGQLVLDRGTGRDGTRIIPESWIADMLENGSRRAWANGDFADMFPKGRYRSCWYQSGNDHGSFCAVGIHGQWIWIDPARRIVLAKVSCLPEPNDDDLIMREIAVLDEIARRL